MKVLIYGAGVIGGQLCHALCACGNDVTVIARGTWAEILRTEGLRIRHYIQRKDTTDRPRVLEAPDEDRYDIVFAVMQYRQMEKILPDLARINSPIVVLTGNNLSASEMEAYIRRNVQKTKSATPALLAGLWEEQLNEGAEILRLRPDGALDITFHAMGNALLHDESEDVDVQIKVPVSYRLSGEWTLEGDSLRIYCPPGKGELLSIDLDKVSLAESVLKSGKEWEKSYRRSFDEYLESASVDQWYAVSFDLTGDLMFLSYPFTSPMGEVQQVRMQLVRKPDTE